MESDEFCPVNDAAACSSPSYASDRSFPILQSLGGNYNAYNEALSLLESQYVTLKANSYDVDSPSHDLIMAIQQCYEASC